MSDTDTINTCNTWISNLTLCESLEKALSLKGNTKFERKVLEVFVSIRNSIIKNNGTVNATAVYAGMISFLSATETDVDTVEACVYILKHVMAESISDAVIRSTTTNLTKIINNILSGACGKNESIVTKVLYCLSKLIAVQNEEGWKSDTIQYLYRSLFSFTTDSRPIINSAACKGVLRIFQSKTKSGSLLSPKHPLNKETLKLLINSIKSQNDINKKRDKTYLQIKTSPEDDRLSYSLTTLEKLLTSKHLNEECVVKYLETLIQCLLSMQIEPIQCQMLNILSNLFIKRILSAEQIARCMTSLFSYLQICSSKSNGKQLASPIPPSSIGTMWLKTVSVGFEKLLLDEKKSFVDTMTGQTVECRMVALSHATQLIKICCDWLLCDCDNLQAAANGFLAKMTSASLETSEFHEKYLDPDLHGDVDSWLTKWAETLSRLLLLQNAVVWTSSINNLTRLVILSVGKCTRMMAVLDQVLPQIAEMRDSYEDTDEQIIASLSNERMRNVKQTLSSDEKVLRLSMESLVGNVIKHYGFGRLVSVLPLTDIVNAGQNTSIDMLSSRTWIVPLIKVYTESTSLDQFRVLILPIIQHITRKIDSLSSSDNMETDSKADAFTIATTTLGTLRYQLWSCLPSFAKKVVPGGIYAVSSGIFESNQYPVPFPAGQDIPTTTLWNLMFDLLNPHQPSNLEVIVLSTIRSLIKTAQDTEEMKAVLTSNIFFPKLLNNLFSLYMNKDKAIQENIKATLSVYLGLFDVAKFDPNCQFLMDKKLADIDPASPSDTHLSCIELMLIIGPHLSQQMMQTVTEYLAKFLDNDKASNQLHKRVYRFLELITASNTETSNEFSKTHLSALLTKLRSWTKIKTDSWKCRMKTLYNLFKLINEPAQVGELLNAFMSEIISCLNMPNKKTRAISGMIFVEGIIACCNADETGEMTMSQSIDRMLNKIIGCLRERLTDNSAQAVQFKGALGKSLYLMLSEQRLSREVTKRQIDETTGLIVDILSNYDSSNTDRHLIYCALDILNGLLKKRSDNVNHINLVDIGKCIAAASSELRMKVRNPIKKILKKMLKHWPYEDIKKYIPDDLIAVLRNIHKALNRSKRKGNDVNDTESFATSWGGVSETGSQMTMKNPHIKNIADLLHDTDSEDDDIKTRYTTNTMDNKSIKSMKSTTSRAKDLRMERKRKIASANATLRLEENLDDIVDLSDPTSMVRNMRLSDKNDCLIAQPSTKLADKTVDKRGFHFENGRLVIGKSEEAAKQEDEKKNDDDDSENEHYKSEKQRFQPVKKRARRDKLPGSEYKPNKKGAFGDIKRENKPDPYAYIPFKTTDQCHNVMKRYEKQIKKAQKSAREMSKLRKQRN